MKKRILSLMTATLLLASVLSACGASASSAAPPADAASSTEQPAASAAESSEDAITLTYWDGWVDAATEPTAAAVQKALEQWEAEHPNVKIEADHTTSGDGTYKTKIKSALASGQAPDVFLMSKGSFAQPYVEAGALLQMDELLGADGLAGMNDGVIETATYSGGIYGIPFNMHINGIFCNTEIFEQHGVELPTTYDELIAACETFRAAGVTPIAMGNKELWQSIQFFEPILIKLAGLDYCMQACEKEASFDTQETVDAANIMLDVVQAGGFSEGLAGLTFIEGAAEFAQGNAAMTCNGTWGMAAFEGDDVPVSGKVTMIKFPSLPGGKGSDNDLQAGPYEHFSINAATAHPQEAMEFALFMSKAISENCVLDGSGLPVWEHESASNESPLYNQAVAISQQAENYMSGWDFYLESSVATEYMNLASALILDQITAEDFAAQLQAANA